MPSVFELLFDTYGNHLMQEQAPYDEAEIQAAPALQASTPLTFSCAS